MLLIDSSMTCVVDCKVLFIILCLLLQSGTMTVLTLWFLAQQLSREILDIAAEAVDVGVTTDEIDRLVHEVISDRVCCVNDLQNIIVCIA